MEIKKPIRLLLLRLQENDVDVNDFCKYFRNALNVPPCHIFADECKPHVADAIQYLSGLKSTRQGPSAFNVMLVVTHGTKDGQPSFEKHPATKSVKTLKLLESWNALKTSVYSIAENCLLMAAVCFSGKAPVVRGLEIGADPFFWIVTPAEGKPLAVEDGAKAMADFLNRLTDKGITQVDQYAIPKLLGETNRAYGDVLHLWEPDEARRKSGEKTWI